MITREQLAGREVRLASLPRFAAEHGADLAAVPYSGRVLLESLLHVGDTGTAVTLAARPAAGQDAELKMAFRPARIVMQDYTGIPLLVDLAAPRDRVDRPERVNPVLPVDVVVDHSVQADLAARPDAQAHNEALEHARNAERYAFLKWAQGAFDGLGVFGWGTGGLEAEALMPGLDQPIRIPPIVGIRLTGTVGPGVSPTDVVLTLTQRLHEENIRGLLVEFTGSGVDALTAADRCTIANMGPEYGAMAAYFPVDTETLRYLRQTGRRAEDIALAEAYCRHQGLLRRADAPEPCFGREIRFDLAAVRPSLAGPSRPDQRIALTGLPASFARFHGGPVRTADGLSDGDIVIASITSCTSTSNPQAMPAAGLLARRAVERGLSVPERVKTKPRPPARGTARRRHRCARPLVNP
ncbi:aconitase family protein [Streptomyces roseifaciens]